MVRYDTVRPCEDCEQSYGDGNPCRTRKYCVDYKNHAKTAEERTMNIIVTRKTIIREFAKKIADIQKRADEEYYKPHLKDYIPEPGENNHAAWLLDRIMPLREMCKEMGILEQVYKEAYKIYDFRNSGKDGYTLKDGKIIEAYKIFDRNIEMSPS